MTKDQLNIKALSIIDQYNGVLPYWSEEGVDFAYGNYVHEVELMNKCNFNVLTHLSKLLELYKDQLED